MDLKEAKELLKEGIVNSVGNKKTGMAESCKEYQKAIETILQELDNLQKENEELKKGNEALRELADFRQNLINNKYIQKEKIEEKIEFIKSLKEKFYYEENVISILESLID